MTAAVNLKTGRAYIGYNGKGVDFRTGNERFNPTVSELDDEVVMLVEKTKNRALEASKQAGGEVKDSFEKWTVDNCAEVQAVNQAVKDGAKVEDILLSTIEVLPNKYKKKYVKIVRKLLKTFLLIILNESRARKIWITFRKKLIKF